MDRTTLYTADYNAIKKVTEIIKNVSHTNIFPVVLTADKYERINDFTFKKGSDHIEVANIRGEWKYRNLNCKWDTGNIVQFIANRWDDNLRQCNDVSVVHAAAFVAKGYYKDLKKQMRQEHKPARKIADSDRKGVRKQH